MPITCQYDRERGILRASIDGNPDPSELVDVLETIIQSNEHTPDVPAIWDLRNLSFEKYESAVARTLRDIHRRFPARSSARTAYVVRNQLGFGMVRMFQHLSETDTSSRVFYDYAEAEQWLMGHDRH